MSSSTNLVRPPEIRGIAAAWLATVLLQVPVNTFLLFGKAFFGADSGPEGLVFFSQWPAIALTIPLLFASRDSHCGNTIGVLRTLAVFSQVLATLCLLLVRSGLVGGVSDGMYLLVAMVIDLIVFGTGVWYCVHLVRGLKTAPASSKPFPRLRIPKRTPQVGQQRPNRVRVKLPRRDGSGTE